MARNQSFRSSEDQPFSGCTNWRSDLLSFCSVSQIVFQGQKFVTFSRSGAHSFKHSQKVMGGVLIFISILFGCPDISYTAQVTPTHFNVVHDNTPFLSGTRTHVFRSSSCQPLDHHCLDRTACFHSKFDSALEF